jgi:hypothetical protein
MTPQEIKDWEKKFIVSRQGKDFVLYAGLLDMAHKSGLVSMITECKQIPDESNHKTAICTATATFQKDGVSMVFTGIGDAAPNNVAPAMQTCLIRMAETRAKSRALRDGVNIGVASIEELGNGAGDDTEQQEEQQKPTVTTMHTQQRDIEAEFKAKKLAFGAGGIHDFTLIRKIMDLPAGTSLYDGDYRDCLDKADDEKWRTAIALIQLQTRNTERLNARCAELSYTGDKVSLVNAVLGKDGGKPTPEELDNALNLSPAIWQGAIDGLMPEAPNLALISTEEVPVVEASHTMDAFTDGIPAREKVGA